MNLFSRLIVSFCFLLALVSCSTQKQIYKSDAQQLLKAAPLAGAHVGISIIELSSNKYWFNYQGDHYFVPASNMKIPTCYAAMKYLGDSLEGIIKIENDTSIVLLPTGDPTLLHPDYSRQPVITYLLESKKNVYATDVFWKDEPLGSGWSWDDYNEPYMAERSALPVYGNVLKWTQEIQNGEPPIIYSTPEVNWNVDFDTAHSNSFSVTRKQWTNDFTITEGKEPFKEQSVPFVTKGINTALGLLADTIHKQISVLSQASYQKIFFTKPNLVNWIHSQPLDSVLRPMMHRSDNFFAEQMLLMVSAKLLNKMNDEIITDSLLNSDLKGLPQKPRWADGSGLSRYNLFSPQDFVFILGKMMKEFGMERVKKIFPGGNEGTLLNYYVADQGFIFAKTGSLSGVIALSGFLYTKKNKLLAFSVLVNNHNARAADVRRSVERFVEAIRNKY